MVKIKVEKATVQKPIPMQLNWINQYFNEAPMVYYIYLFIIYQQETQKEGGVCICICGMWYILSVKLVSVLHLVASMLFKMLIKPNSFWFWWNILPMQILQPAQPPKMKKGENWTTYLNVQTLSIQFLYIDIQSTLGSIIYQPTIQISNVRIFLSP